MKKKKDNRRQFLKNTSLSLLSFTVFPAILKSENSTVLLNKKITVLTAMNLLKMHMDKVLFIQQMHLLLRTINLRILMKLVQKLLLVAKYIILTVQKLFQIQKLTYGMLMMQENTIT